MSINEPLEYSQDEWVKIIHRAYKSLPSTYQSYKTPEPGSPELARLIDHTLLKTDATSQQIDKICEEARKFQFKVSLCESLTLFYRKSIAKPVILDGLCSSGVCC